MPTLNYFDPWLISYKPSVSNPVERTRADGYTRQKKTSHRRTFIVKVSRIVAPAQLAYFEWFCRSVIDYGSKKFTDYYSDGDGVTQGTIRIVGGSYNARAATPNWIIECDIEVFR